jgi:hypothetical protein
MTLVDSMSRASLGIFFLAAASFAQPPLTPSAHPDPAELARTAVQNEIKAARDNHVNFMFRSTKTTPKGSTTKIYVETRDATAGMVIAYNDKPLTPEQRRAEAARLERFLNNPEELRKKRKQEREDADRTLRIVRAIPDAFLFEYAGEELGTPGVGQPGDPLIALKFHPNPSYEPPSRVEQVLTGMQGVLLVDAVRHRIARIDGKLFKDVSFGWGILGHLDKGGHFLVQQQAIGDDRWEISRMSLDLTGKILLVKNLTIKSTEVYTGFKQVPSDLTFAQALDLLKKEEAVVAENPTTGKMTFK